MTSGDKQFLQFDTWREIVSQGQVWTTVLNELSGSAQVGEVLDITGQRRQFLFVGCGTSFYLAEAAALSWTLLSGQPAKAVPASEVLLYPNLFNGKDADSVAFVISRSGRTSEALRAAGVLKKDLRLPTIGTTCAGDSELQALCDETLVLHAADEKSTVMTRSFTSMLLCLQFLAARCTDNSQFIDSLQQMANKFASRTGTIAEALADFVGRHSFADYVFLGQGPFHGIAREAALKVTEMSCSYSQFFHTLEFRHGPKAIVSPSTCLTFFLSHSGYKAEAEVLEEMKELGGTTIAICNHADDALSRCYDLVIDLDVESHELALLAPYTVPCQLLGFFTGLKKGLNPDVPKNLSRVVILD